MLLNAGCQTNQKEKKEKQQQEEKKKKKKKTKTTTTTWILQEERIAKVIMLTYIRSSYSSYLIIIYNLNLFFVVGN